MSRRGIAGSERAQRVLRQAEKRLARQREDDLRELLSLPAGRRFVWRLVDEIAGVHGTTFTGNSQTFHLEGRRSVGIDLMLEIQRLDPGLWLQVVADRMQQLRDDQAHKRAAEEAAREEDGDE